MRVTVRHSKKYMCVPSLLRKWHLGCFRMRTRACRAEGWRWPFTESEVVPHVPRHLLDLAHDIKGLIHWVICLFTQLNEPMLIMLNLIIR